MNPKELVETALRVLVAWNDGRVPSTADLEILRLAFPNHAALPSDDLACQVINSLAGRNFEGETGSAGSPQQKIA